MPVAEAVAVATQVARGLAAAHERGIVHRDVKPGNIMLLPDGSVKLLDFGLAVLSDATLGGAGITPGTIPYMAPEQARGESAGPRSDLFGLGVVLYEMIAGVRPFRATSQPAVVQAILHDEPEPLHRRMPGTPEAIDRIVTRLLRKDPSARYATANELLADLERLSSPSPSA
jgi:serine/threonine-protein kinase